MKYHTLSTEGYERLRDTYGISDLVAKVCAAKRLDEEKIKELLAQDTLSDPFSANGIKEAVARIHQAREHGEKVLVCGDYDADGICATTILYDALRRYGITCGFYIPNRIREGYGLHVHTVDMAKEKGYTLLITVDNGVKAKAALQRCKECGIDVIVSDHHTIEEEVNCDLLVHSKNMGAYFENLCGAGIALILSRALLGEVKEHVVLAAVASIGDVMSLWHETRNIVKRGLRYLREGVCLPIQYLSKDAYPKWDERMIAFQVVPKLNTTGRLADMANANNTVRYLLMSERNSIMAFAKQMEELNQKRRLMSTKMSEYAATMVQKGDLFPVIYHEDFHEGLIGIVAGKLCEEFQAPVLVFAQGKEELKGSIRSNHIVDLRDFFADCPVSLLAYGGHFAAAGISIRKEDLPALIAFVHEKMARLPKQEQEKGAEVIGCQMHDLRLQAVEELESLAPFGEGFTKPVFHVEDYAVKEIRSLSNGKHIKWESLEQVDALYFNGGDIYARYANATHVSFLGSLSVNRFRNEKKVNILVSEVIS